MGANLDTQQIIDTIKNVLRAEKGQGSEKIDIDGIGEETDLRQIDLDSLDMIGFRFALDEALSLEIPDEDFEEKELAVVKNLIAYLKEKKQ